MPCTRMGPGHPPVRVVGRLRKRRQRSLDLDRLRDRIQVGTEQPRARVELEKVGVVLCRAGGRANASMSVAPIAAAIASWSSHRAVLQHETCRTGALYFHPPNAAVYHHRSTGGRTAVTPRLHPEHPSRPKCRFFNRIRVGQGIALHDDASSHSGQQQEKSQMQDRLLKLYVALQFWLKRNRGRT